jgi:hypothetical protein
VNEGEIVFKVRSPIDPVGAQLVLLREKRFQSKRTAEVYLCLYAYYFPGFYPRLTCNATQKLGTCIVWIASNAET